MADHRDQQHHGKTSGREHSGRGRNDTARARAQFDEIRNQAALRSGSGQASGDRGMGEDWRQQDPEAQRADQHGGNAPPFPDDETETFYGEERQRRYRFDGERFRAVPGPHAGHGPRDYRRADDRIREDVCEMLTHDGFVDARDIDVRVENGEVTLEGHVGSRVQKRRAEDLAERIAGVVDVHNHLRTSKAKD